MKASLFAALKVFFCNYLPVLILLGGYIGYEKYYRTDPSPSAAVDGKALGKGYQAHVLADLAAAWEKGAAGLNGGMTVAGAQGVVQTEWESARKASFAAAIAPGFAKVLPEGTEAADPTTRAAVVKLWNDFAAGLKGKGGAK